MDEELNIIEPRRGSFWKVTVTVEIPNEKTGQPKKTKEIHLVDATDLEDIQRKVLKAMEGTMYDWEITDSSKSNFQLVY